jgi:hypothetical protein
VKHDLRSKSVSTKVSEAELRVLESRAERAGLTLSEWVRDVLLGSSVDAGTMAAERAILAEMLAMRGWPRSLAFGDRGWKQSSSSVPSFCVLCGRVGKHDSNYAAFYFRARPCW